MTIAHVYNEHYNAYKLGILKSWFNRSTLISYSNTCLGSSLY